jgi:hypothetical protein
MLSDGGINSALQLSVADLQSFGMEMVKIMHAVQMCHFIPEASCSQTTQHPQHQIYTAKPILPSSSSGELQIPTLNTAMRVLTRRDTQRLAVDIFTPQARAAGVDGHSAGSQD